MSFRLFLVGFAWTLAIAQPNIPSLVTGNPELSTLALALSNNGLIPTLSGAGPFTVFGPTNAAFTAAGANVVDFVTNGFNTATNAKILTYHVATDAIYSFQLFNGQTIATLDPPYTLNVSIAGPVVKINNATVVTTDLNASNGVLHIIDGVLVPGNFALPSQDIVTLALATPSLSTLVAALGAASLVSALQCTVQQCSPYTVFAPTNDAFAKLPATLLASLLKDPVKLTQILTYHLIDHRDYSTELNGTAVTTVEGDNISFTVVNNKIIVNGNATIVTSDIQAQNGVIHIIDAVLIPNGFVPPTTPTDSSPSSNTLSGGAIAGIVVGSAAAVATVGGVVWWWRASSAVPKAEAKPLMSWA